MLNDLPNFDKLWNYNDPAGTEQKFREILAENTASNDFEYIAQLLTQIARCEGLQGRFKEAHSTLDNAYKLILTNNLRLAHVRYLLERGRALNSNGEPETAKPLFQKAYELAEAQDEMRYAIDAIHMIAIVEADPQDQIEWNLKGIALAESDPTQKGWLFALLNNIGESYMLVSDYVEAYKAFKKLSELQVETHGQADLYTVKDMAKTLRLQGNPGEGFTLIQGVLDKLEAEKKDDGYIRQEMAESLYALGKANEAKPHFAKACELLMTDDWAAKYEEEPLARMKELSGGG